MDPKGEDTAYIQIPVSLTAISPRMEKEILGGQKVASHYPSLPLRRPNQGDNPITFPDGRLPV